MKLPLSITLLAIGFLCSGVADAAAKPVLRSYLNNQCIVADEPYFLPESDPALSSRSLFGALIVQRVGKAIVQRGVKGVIGRVGKSAARRDTEYLVARNVNLYKTDLAASPELALNYQDGCITIVAGQFEPDSTDCTADYQPRQLTPEMAARPDDEWMSERGDPSVRNVLRRANVCLSAPAQSVYEVRINYSEDGTAFRLESAGYWINSLLTSNSRRASRHLVYTLELHEPSQGTGSTLLTSAWVNVGPVSAGDVSTEVADLDRSEWVSVPQLSRLAAQVYEKDTAIHQDVYGRIQALERSTENNRLLLEGLIDGQKDARPAVQERLEADIADVEYKIVSGEALLRAKRLEYDELDQAVNEYMPVTIELGVTETKSERRARALLAEFLAYNSDLITASANSRLGVNRSLEFGDESPPSPEEQSAARDNYYDALIDLETTPSDAAQRQLDQAKTHYNEVRASAGIEPIP